MRPCGSGPKQSLVLHLAAFLSVIAWVSFAGSQVLDAELRATLFLEPSSDSDMTVLNPAVDLVGRPAEWLAIRAGYEADIVSGASESVKSGPLTPDVVSGATELSDLRHVASGGFSITREDTDLSVGYAFGTESDYRSHAFTVSAGTTFLQKNTELRLAYGRGFDQVCTTNFDQANAPSTRTALDSSDGCFTDAERRATRDINLDNLQVAWTQAWTPLLSTQLVLSAGLQNGFLGNPYRSVVITPSGDVALENHPDDRARGALALRGLYFVRPIETAFGLSVRLYRDTWDLFSQNVELSADHYLLNWLRLRVLGRFYNQSGALFFSDDYTGGEPETGPRGRYWTGDRELSALQSYLVGGRFIGAFRGKADRRVIGIFSSLSLSAGADLLKTDLLEFTWGGRHPDDTLALVFSLSLSASF